MKEGVQNLASLMNYLIKVASCWGEKRDCGLDQIFLPHFQTLMLPKTIVHSEVCEALKNVNQLHLRLGNRQKEVVGSFKAKIILDNCDQSSSLSVIFYYFPD